MDGSPSAVLSVGFGTWGSTGLVLTLGYGAGVAQAIVPGPFRVTAAQGFIPGASASQGVTPGASSAQGI
jgi:hypothetical protein